MLSTRVSAVMRCGSARVFGVDRRLMHWFHRIHRGRTPAPVNTTATRLILFQSASVSSAIRADFPVAGRACSRQSFLCRPPHPWHARRRRDSTDTRSNRRNARSESPSRDNVTRPGFFESRASAPAGRRDVGGGSDRQGHVNRKYVGPGRRAHGSCCKRRCRVVCLRNNHDL